jgi:hypothetical protein
MVFNNIYIQKENQSSPIQQLNLTQRMRRSKNEPIRNFIHGMETLLPATRDQFWGAKNDPKNKNKAYVL